MTNTCQYLWEAHDPTQLIQNMCVQSSFSLEYFSFSPACLFTSCNKSHKLLPHAIKRKYRLKYLNVKMLLAEMYYFILYIELFKLQSDS